MNVGGRRLTRLDRNLLRHLESGVLGDWVQVDQLATATGKPSAEVHRRLDELSGWGFVRFPVTPFIGAIDRQTRRFRGVGGETQKTSVRIDEQGRAALTAIHSKSRRFWIAAAFVITTIVTLLGVLVVPRF